ncbi:MAG: GMC oxidoreductase, partial [Croceibacterium sp.]
QLRVFGYQNLLVCDGSAIPANPGVNPSLTITALAEHAMSKVPSARTVGLEAALGPASLFGSEDALKRARGPKAPFIRSVGRDRRVVPVR